VPRGGAVPEPLIDVEAALHRQRERFDAVVAIGRAIGSTLDLDELLTLVIEHTSRLVRAERSTLFLIDEQREEIWSKVVQGEGLTEIRLPLGSGIAGWVCKFGQSVVLNDVAADHRFNPDIDRSTGFRTRSMAVVPVHDVTGAVIGAIQALNGREGGFSNDDRTLLAAIAAQAGAAIEHARLYRDTVARNRELTEAKEALAETVAELDLLFEIEKTISGASTLEQLLDVVLAKAMATIGADAGCILVLDESSGQLLFKSALGEHGEQIKAFKLSLGEGLAGKVAATGQPVVCDDAASHPDFQPHIAKEVGYETRAVLCVPLLSAGRPVGALELINPRKGRFEPRDLKVATLMASQLGRAVVVARERVEGERRARLAAIGQMLSGLLHDLRTPMTIISGYSELMAEEPDPAERGRQSELILKQLDHMSAMAKETLAFARGERELLLSKVHLNRFLEEIGELLSHELEGKGIALRIQGNYQGAMRMDEGKIKRAIYNIARNAVQAMPSGGRFTITVDREGEQVLFRLADTGTGIPEEIAGRLFQSFVTAGKKDGTGLGLAIVKKVVEEHGGRVSFTSVRGEGTTFTLSIPL